MSSPEVGLYCATVDADCLAARLLLGALDVSYREIVVDVLPGTDVESRRVLAEVPGRSLPLLRLGEGLVGDLIPVLTAIAAAFDPEGRRLDRSVAATHWLEFAIGPLRAANRARSSAMSDGSDPESDEECPAKSYRDSDSDTARQAMLVVEDTLASRWLRSQRWIAGDHSTRPTLADFALYPAIALSRDFGLEHHEFPAIRRWLRDVRMLAPHVAMPGILDPI